MRAYILRRLWQSALSLVGVSLVVFVLIRLVPGDPAMAMLPEGASETDRAIVRRQLGLEEPGYVQYAIFLRRAIQGDLGTSIYFGKPVVAVVGDHLPATAELAFAAMGLALLVALPAGIISALRRDSILDYLSMLMALVGQSIPTYWLGMMLVLLFSVKWRLLPTGGQGEMDHLVLPAVSLGTYLMALVTRLTRSGMLDAMSEDYVRTARSKGLSEVNVVVGHALKNVLIPLVTVIGLQLGGLLGGAVVTETVFSWQGIGWVAVTAIVARDYPLIQGIVLTVAVIYMVINLVIDILYCYLDPRIRYS